MLTALAGALLWWRWSSSGKHWRLVVGNSHGYLGVVFFLMEIFNFLFFRHILNACGLPAGLRTLRLGLSGVRSLALALPMLTALDVNNAAELRCLELRCPLLLTVHMQACK
jgi:hypothetical protein